MGTTTTNLGLFKPALTDPADITQLNNNWDKVDSEIKRKADLIDGKVPSEQLPEISTVDGLQATLSLGWSERSDGAFELGLTVDGVTPDSNVIVDCNLTLSDIDADIAVMEAWSCVNNAKVFDGFLVFYCYGEKPTISIPLNLVVM